MEDEKQTAMEDGRCKMEDRGPRTEDRGPKIETEDRRPKTEDNQPLTTDHRRTTTYQPPQLASPVPRKLRRSGGRDVGRWPGVRSGLPVERAEIPLPLAHADAVAVLQKRDQVLAAKPN